MVFPVPHQYPPLSYPCMEPLCDSQLELELCVDAAASDWPVLSVSSPPLSGSGRLSLLQRCTADLFDFEPLERDI